MSRFITIFFYFFIVIFILMFLFVHFALACLLCIFYGHCWAGETKGSLKIVHNPHWLNPTTLEQLPTTSQSQVQCQVGWGMAKCKTTCTKDAVGIWLKRLSDCAGGSLGSSIMSCISRSIHSLVPFPSRDVSKGRWQKGSATHQTLFRTNPERGSTDSSISFLNIQ